MTAEPWLAIFLAPWPHPPVRRAGKRGQCLDQEGVGLVKSEEPWPATYLHHFSGSPFFIRSNAWGRYFECSVTLLLMW